MKVIKIEKEIGVGLNTVVEFLHTNGYDIEAKPAAIVSKEMCKALLKEFHSSYKIKSKAYRMILGNRTPLPHKKKIKNTFSNKTRAVSTF